MTNNFPLLNQIDEGIHAENLDWNKNAFQTLLTSNLPSTTILYYAIDVGLRRIENSLHEAYLDITTDALNDLSQFLLQPSVDQDIDAYLYEAKCQLLMYSAIGMIKMNMIRRRSTHDAKMACATICLLLLHQSKSYENPSIVSEYSSCIRSMRCRYLKRIFMIVQWLPTLSTSQFDDLQTHHERYIALILDQLYPAVTLRDKIHHFIDHSLLSNTTNDDEAATSSGFVLIRRFPVFNQKILDKHQELMNMGLTNTLNQLNHNPVRKLICCIWTLCCMIESDRISLGIISYNTLREHFSSEPIDFEQKPVLIESLNERDVIVFLLLCAQQNVHLHNGESILHPYLLFSSAHLCTQQQKNWWQTAIEQIPSNEFLDHLATIRLEVERIHQHPPKSVLLETARILFKSAQRLYEQHSKHAASSYEQYAIQYLQTAKATQESNKSNTKQEKFFFFYYQKANTHEQHAIEQCEKLARQCDELKLLPEPEPPRTSSPTKEQQKDIDISAILSPVVLDKAEVERNLDISDTTLFATPPSNKSHRDIDVQTSIQSPVILSLPMIDDISESPLPPYVDLIFSHMNEVNKWINQFCTDTETIQNDIHTIRISLDKINRITSQMMLSTGHRTS